LGFKYLTASTKEEFLSNIDEYLNPKISQSYIFEIFTQDVNECEALKLMKMNGLKDTIQEKMKDNGLDVLVYKAKDKFSGLFK
jgi:2-succinyl-5-enolpyruvyl-6-hydroxy-3-cyclohexene-1-carboxylate synthase